MTVAELQQEITKLSDEDREMLAGWIELLKQMKTPAFQKELGDAMRRMDAGKKVTEEQVQATHERLLAREG